MPDDLQAIDGLEYSLRPPSEDDCEWLPVTEAIPLLQGHTISFRAKPKHPEMGWPNGVSVWTGNCWFTGPPVDNAIRGEVATAWFNKPDPVTIRATYGDSSATATARISPQGSLWLRSDKNELMAGADPASEYGFTDLTAQVRNPDLRGVPGITVSVVAEDASGDTVGQIVCPSEPGYSFVTDADGIALPVHRGQRTNFALDYCNRYSRQRAGCFGPNRYLDQQPVRFRGTV